MAYKSCSSLLSVLLIFNIILGLAQLSVAARQVPSPENVDMKQPDWFIDHHDGSVLIPGFGRVLVPSLGGGGYNYSPYVGSTGGTGGVGGDNSGSYGAPGTGGVGGDNSGSYGGANGNYIPGGDDTFVPNPGVEVPNPVGGGGGVPGAAIP